MPKGQIYYDQASLHPDEWRELCRMMSHKTPKSPKTNPTLTPDRPKIVRPGASQKVE